MTWRCGEVCKGLVKMEAAGDVRSRMPVKRREHIQEVLKRKRANVAYMSIFADNENGQHKARKNLLDDFKPKPRQLVYVVVRLLGYEAIRQLADDVIGCRQ